MVSADVPQVCTTQTMHIDGIAVGAAAPTSSTVSQELTIPTALPDAVTHLSVAGGSLSVAKGDLAFLDSVSVQLVPPTSAQAPFSLLEYRRSGSVPPFINIPATSRELASYLGSSGAQVMISVTGRPPQNGADLALELCVDAGLDQTFTLSQH